MIKMSRLIVAVLVISSFFSACAYSGVQVDGELKVWHKVTVSFDGPETSEMAEVNPFLDYRLDVTFLGPTGQELVVPGYYAADGDAGNTGASSGKVWRVHLRADEVGVWRYSVSFKTGKDIAVLGSVGKGHAVEGVDGLKGTIEITASDKTGRDFRGKGMLQYVFEPFLKFAGTGEYFLKCGVDAPENLLAYGEIDGTFKKDGIKDELIKGWRPHVKDWKEGDPSWGQCDGKKGQYGKGLIGAINYLASEELNAVSFLTMNIEGDDRNVFPYVDYKERVRLDVSRLDQWEVVFSHAERLGLFLHFKTQETENDHLLDGGELGRQRTLYYRELIARFGHHLALNWNLGEENTNKVEQVKEFCVYFHKTDPYKHPVVMHTYPNQKEMRYEPLLGLRLGLDGVSLQTDQKDFRNVHGDVLAWRTASQKAGKPWVVSCDEPGDAGHALVPDKDDMGHDNARVNALWGAVLAGGAGLEWYFGYQHDDSDLTCQDFRSRDLFWDQCRIMLRFFKENSIPFWLMAGDDSVLNDTDGYCLRKGDELFVVLVKKASDVRLELPKGEYRLQWFNPRNGKLSGKRAIVAKDSTGTMISDGPADTDKDWVILIDE